MVSGRLAKNLYPNLSYKTRINLFHYPIYVKSATNGPVSLDYRHAGNLHTNRRQKSCTLWQDSLQEFPSTIVLKGCFCER